MAIGNGTEGISGARSPLPQSPWCRMRAPPNPRYPKVIGTEFGCSNDPPVGDAAVQATQSARPLPTNPIWRLGGAESRNKE